ncbi:DNA ligase/mRNA capping enzyme, partial [Aureobasidium melanogenum]
MSFKFAYFCDYLERCEEITCHDPPLPPSELKSRLYRQHATWFSTHHKAIDALDELGTTTLLSSFLPHRRKDRIYGLQSTSLLKLLGRCLGLSASARQELASFQNPNNGDLGDCLQRLLMARGPPALPFVTLQDADDVLHALAAGNRFSAHSVRQSFLPSTSIDTSLSDVFMRLHPVEAKWLVRLILKDFASVSLNESSILASVHFLLPDLLGMQDSFENACAALKTNFADYPSRPDPQSRNILRQTALSSFRPIPGVKVSRPEYTKARSIKHCLQMTAGGKWLVERKYDGEYCQIHVDLTRGDDWLRIYSKSGRDSTEDRAGLRSTIKRCLRIGSDKCRVKRACILVGEMVVFSDVQDSILGFDEIRKHVSRAGSFIGVENYPPRQSSEHLMIVLFDLLLLDDEDVLSRSVEERKARLNTLYKRLHGRAVPAESCVMDFSQATAERRLMDHFAASIACRHEGLVLKRCGVPYQTHDSLNGIKLKKDYIAGLGDEADFAVVAASYSSQEAKKQSGLRLKPTTTNAGVTCSDPVSLLLSNTTMDQQRPWSRSGISPHSRSMSERKAKRFSLTFPIQTSLSPTSTTLSPVLPYTPLLPEKPTLPAGPTDSAFLTALAAHERRVLELREELIKAEHELHRLKQTWAAHEAHKKRQHDPRRLHKMQSMHPAVDTADPAISSRQHDMERRRALLTSNKNSNRTVFSGSRHARALSLLSPDAMRPPPARLQPQPRPEQDSSRPPHPARVPTDADLTTEVARTADDAIDLGLPREVLLKTGKQMASDFRDGLWTFIEDLRQATVGDEGINGTTSRTQSRSPNPSRSPGPQPSRASLKPSPNTQPLKRSATTGSRRTNSRSPAPSAAEEIAYLDIGNSFWKEHDPTPAPILRKPSKKSIHPPAKVNRASTSSLDAWESWDPTVPTSDPKPSRSNSSVSEPHTSSSPDGTSPRTSMSSSRDTKRDSLPWPALNKLAPSNLRRTASHLMNEWEKSLSPSPAEGDRQGDYMGRAISPAGSFKETKND